MNASREDYLKLIYSANLLKNKLTNKEISEQLQLSPPSVSEMIGKLIIAGKLTKDETLGYKLEKSGILEAQNLIRKHRLWEVFLVNYLGYHWQDVHQDAEILEHATSDLLANRLDAFLQHPQACPHGSVIYGNVKNPPVRVRLETLAVGESAIIKEVFHEELFMKYLISKNITINDHIQVMAIEPFDQSIQLKIKDNTVEISHQAALKILVEIN